MINQMMRISLFSLGLITVALLLLILSVLEITGIINFTFGDGLIGTLNFPSLGVILGGVLLSAALAYSKDDIMEAVNFAKYLLLHPNFGSHLERRDIQDIFRWKKTLKSNESKARSELTHELNNTFEGYIFTLANSNYSVEKIEELGLIKAKEHYSKKRETASFFEQLADTSPAFGMLGTLVGLIFMLQRFENVRDLGEGLAFALMTTFYGLILAYALFNPLAKKAALYADKTFKRDLFLLNGIIMIIKGEEPLVVFDHLCADREGYLFDNELNEMEFG